MQTFTLFCADVRENQRNVCYPNKVEISGVDDLSRAAAFDHTASEFVGNRRSRAGFLSADCVPLDLDNDHSEAPADWKSLSDVQRSFPGVEFFAVASRNHLRQKGDKAPREKWHVYFPVHTTSDAGAIETIKRRAARIFQWFDQNALDAARFFYGVSNPQVRYFPGEITLDTYLLCFAPPEVAEATPQKQQLQAPDETASLPAPPVPNERRPVISVGADVPEGSRNQELYRLAFRRFMQGLPENEVRLLTEAANDHFSSPLPGDELQALVRSACSKDLDRAAFIQRAEVAAELAEAVQNAGEGGKADSEAAHVLCLANLEEKHPEWLVPDLIPRGTITLLAGDGGVGKTFIWTSIAAGISAGQIPGVLRNPFVSDVEERTAPERVFYLSAEDDNAAVLLPRLSASGADLSQIFTVDCTDDLFPQLRFGSPALEKLIAEKRPSLMIFDPLQAFLPRGADMAKRNDMRQSLGSLLALGGRYGTAFLIVCHCNKSRGVWGRTRVADSADLTDMARSVLMVGNADRSTNLRYIAPEKASYGPLAPTTLFRVDGNCAVFAGTSEMRDRDFIRADEKRDNGAPERENAERFILDYVRQHGGRVPVRDLDEAAAANLISAQTLRRSKESLKLKQKIVIQKERGWFVATVDTGEQDETKQ